VRGVIIYAFETNHLIYYFLINTELLLCSEELEVMLCRGGDGSVQNKTQNLVKERTRNCSVRGLESAHKKSLCGIFSSQRSRDFFQRVA
jgi:hypothetical protein